MGVFKKLGEEIADLSQLNVQTFTGDLKSIVNEAADGNVIDWKKLLDSSKSAGSVTLVASSKFNFDGDSDTFVARDITPELLEAHTAAVQAGQKVREGLIALFRELVPID